MGLTEIWLPPAAIQIQEQGPEYFEVVDGKPWSDQTGFHRGFSTSFRIRAGKEVWFHFPFPTPVRQNTATEVHAESVSLLWETEGGAQISWVVLHHGGIHRQHLTEPGVPISGRPQPYEPPAQWRQYYPDCAPIKTDLAVEPPMRMEFGLQLCVLARAEEAPGTIRFYGAGVIFSAQPNGASRRVSPGSPPASPRKP